MRSLALRTVIALSTLGVALATTMPAHAGDGEGSGSAAAESLFQDARKLMDAKRYGEACPKFAASQKLAPAVGTLLNLADCYEKNNQLASAWTRFHEAVALAQRLGRTNREQTARERADKLEPRLIKLSILARATGVEVKLDGEPSVVGTPIPVDPGAHTIEATAKGKKSYRTSIEVTDKEKAPSVDIPPLEDEPVLVTKNPAGEKTTEPAKAPSPGWSTQKTLGAVAAGAGILGLGVGGFFGLRTSSTWEDAKTHCSDLECDEDGVALAARAKTSGTISTIAFIAGGALLAGGAVLFFTATPAKTGSAAAPLRVGIGPGSIVLGGTFR